MYFLRRARKKIMRKDCFRGNSPCCEFPAIPDPDNDRIVSHDAPRFMLYYHCVRDISRSLHFSTRVMSIAVLDVYGFQTCFGSTASAFENILSFELADFHCASKKNFSVTLKGYMCFTDLSRTTCVLGRHYKHKV